MHNIPSLSGVPPLPRDLAERWEKLDEFDEALLIEEVWRHLEPCLASRGYRYQWGMSNGSGCVGDNNEIVDLQHQPATSRISSPINDFNTVSNSRRMDANLKSDRLLIDTGYLPVLVSYLSFMG